MKLSKKLTWSRDDASRGGVVRGRGRRCGRRAGRRGSRFSHHELSPVKTVVLRCERVGSELRAGGGWRSDKVKMSNSTRRASFPPPSPRTTACSRRHEHSSLAQPGKVRSPTPAITYAIPDRRARRAILHLVPEHHRVFAKQHPDPHLRTRLHRPPKLHRVRPPRPPRACSAKEELTCRGARAGCASSCTTGSSTSR